MTKGCLLAAGDASPLGAAAAAAGEAEEGSGVPLQVAALEGEDGREERRRPLKWAPTADSSTSSIAAVA
jgi:hypothetical protein